MLDEYLDNVVSTVPPLLAGLSTARSSEARSTPQGRKPPSLRCESIVSLVASLWGGFQGCEGVSTSARNPRESLIVRVWRAVPRGFGASTARSRWATYRVGARRIARVPMRAQDNSTYGVCSQAGRGAWLWSPKQASTVAEDVGVQRDIRARSRLAHPPSWLAVVG